MKKIPLGESDEHSSGNTERRPAGAINMNRIRVEPDQPREPAASRGINLLGIFDPARRRAEAAAQEARLAERRRLDEESKQRGLAEARQQILNQAGGPERTALLPEIGMGARPALKRLAQSDPERALKIARKMVTSATNRNDSMMAAQRAAETARLRAENNQRALNARPVSTTQIDWTQSHLLHESNDDNGFFRTTKRVFRGALGGISALATVAIKGAIATASGKASNAFDTIKVDGSGYHVDAPLSNVPHIDIGLDTSEYDIVANPPPLFDRLVGIASAFPGVSRNSVLGWVPFGTVAVRRKVGNQIIVEAPTLFPGARERELKAAAGKIRMPADPNTQFVPEPTLADLLGEAANALLPGD